MTREEYDTKISVIIRQFEYAKNETARKYALSNNSVELGDLVKGHEGWIKVSHIGTHKGYGDPYPSCVYHGLRCKKDGTPFKRVDTADVYQFNMREHKPNKGATNDE